MLTRDRVRGHGLDSVAAALNIGHIVKLSPTYRKRHGTQALARAFAILRVFSDDRSEWALVDVSRSVGLTRTTAFRMLSALEREGMVARNRSSGAWHLGPRAIELGALAQRSNTLHRAAHTELVELARVTGETTSLEILVGTDVLVLDEVQGSHKLSPAPIVGSRWPAHATSTGKVLLAALGPARPQGYRLARLTSRTITNQARLNAELVLVAKRGFGIAVEELETGYVAVGAPVRNHEEQVVAAASVGGPAVRFGAAERARFARMVMEAADRISHHLGATGRTLILVPS
jgi:DNA-binding IclR family transcriptional regulator